MSNAEAVLALMGVMHEHPGLTIDGLDGQRRPEYRSRRNRLMSHGHEQFEHALDWLQRAPRTEKPNRTSAGHSYAIKHAVENWSGCYVSNGAVIAAAIYLGIPMTECPSGINVWLGVGSRRGWPKRAD